MNRTTVDMADECSLPLFLRFSFSMCEHTEKSSSVFSGDVQEAALSLSQSLYKVGLAIGSKFRPNFQSKRKAHNLFIRLIFQEDIFFFSVILFCLKNNIINFKSFDSRSTGLCAWINLFFIVIENIELNLDCSIDLFYNSWKIKA